MLEGVGPWLLLLLLLLQVEALAVWEPPLMVQGEEAVVALVEAVLLVLTRSMPHLRVVGLVALVATELVMKILMVQVVVEAEEVVADLALARAAGVGDLMDLEVRGAL